MSKSILRNVELTDFWARIENETWQMLKSYRLHCLTNKPARYEHHETNLSAQARICSICDTFPRVPGSGKTHNFHRLLLPRLTSPQFIRGTTPPPYTPLSTQDRGEWTKRTTVVNYCPFSPIGQINITTCLKFNKHKLFASPQFRHLAHASYAYQRFSIFKASAWGPIFDTKLKTRSKDSIRLLVQRSSAESIPDYRILLDGPLPNTFASKIIY